MPPTRAEVHELADIALEVLSVMAGLQMRALILLWFYTLARPGELAALDHHHVDVDSGRLHIEQTMSQWEGLRLPKGGRPRQAILPAPARSAYEDLPRHPTLPYVFWTATGKRPTVRGISRWWWRVRDEWASRQPGRDKKLVLYVATRHAWHFLPPRGMRDEL